MIILFEDFDNKIDISKYIVYEGDVPKIPSIYFNKLDDQYLKSSRLIDIKYNSLVRLYLYLKLLNYKGNNPLIISYIKGIKNKDLKKIEIIRKIPNNNTVFNFINKKFNLNYPNYNYDNINDLQKLINNFEKIFSDNNLIEYIRIVYELSKEASKAENIVTFTLLNFFGRNYEIVHSEEADDLRGLDLLLTNTINGKKESVQVKHVSSHSRFNLKGNTIFINNTNIDLHNYEFKKSPPLHYDYLAFYVENEKNIYIMRTNTIFSISRYENEKTISVKLMYDILPKVLEVKEKHAGDVKKIFY
jgi:hypothetical protein